MSGPLLVLDLDETLISATLEQRRLSGETRFGAYYATPRPGLRRFLQRVRSVWPIAVWTSATESYARPIVEHFVGDSIEFLWDRARCTLHSNVHTRERVYLKDIKKLTRAGYTKEQIIFVDDTPAKIARSYGNYVCVAPFHGRIDDDELEHLGPYLQSLAGVGNVRNLEKRGWRSRTVR